jgi:hypothetical protein
LKRTSLKEPILIFIVIVVILIWGLNTFNTGNPLWFLPIQPQYRPARIIVHHYGQATELRPDDEGFDALAEGLNATLSDFQSRDLVSIGIGEQTLADYYADEFVLEAFYGQNVEFNLPIRLTGINTLLFPIDARHSERNYVFIGNNREYRAGALQVVSREALEAALAETGFPQND